MLFHFSCVPLKWVGGVLLYIYQFHCQLLMTPSPKQDPTKFCNAFDDLTEYIESEEGWKLAVEELIARKVTVF